MGRLADDEDRDGVYRRGGARDALFPDRDRGSQMRFVHDVRVLLVVLGATALLTAALASPALAVPPALFSVSQQDRHPIASFSAPRSDLVVVQVASKPDRATNGDFLSENRVAFDLLTDPEIQAGSWKYDRQIDPGSYFVLVNASPNFSSCYIGPGYDPACADGYSAVLPLTVPKPTATYKTKATVYRSLRRASLTLTATPLGADTPYKVCYRNKKKRKKCLNGTLDGYDWNSAASDDKTVRFGGLAKRTKFTWYIANKAVATRTVKTR